MKKIVLLLILLTLMISCKENKNLSFNSQKESVSFVLEKFPMIDKNLTAVRKIDLDSLSITLLQTSNKRIYDEVLVFEKRNKFYAIPFFSNMYADYWNFESDTQPKLFPKTNSTFEKEFLSLVKTLNLTGEEFNILYKELIFSILHTENNLNNKLSFFQNIIYYSSRVTKYKQEEADDCEKRTNIVYEQIYKDYNSKKIMMGSEYFLDKRNGRVYRFENKAKNYNEIKFNIKTYRIDCYTYPMTM